jgi:hypothetical protein
MAGIRPVKDEGMILVCSRGHEFNTENIGHRVTWGDNRLIKGGRCPMLMSYDRMSGSTYCQRVLKEKVENDEVRKMSKPGKGFTSV